MTTLTLKEQGETLIFFGEADSGAAEVTFEVHLAPGASGPTPHFHPKQTERFSVVSGCIVATIDGEERRAQAGEDVMIHAGQVHTFANGSSTEPLVFRCTAKPALNLQWFLTEMAESAIRGGGRWDDASLLDAGYTLHQIRGEYRFAGMPALVQTAIVSVLAATALLLGKTKRISPRPAARESALVSRTGTD
jgi:quercetin dioxygenase-like cupin family protein